MDNTWYSEPPTAETLLKSVEEKMMTGQQGGILISEYGLPVLADAVLQPGTYTLKFLEGEQCLDCAQSADTSR